jgi:hypothetical protein
MVERATVDGTTARVSLRLPGGRTEVPAGSHELEAAVRSLGHALELSCGASPKEEAPSAAVPARCSPAYARSSR